MTPKVMAVLISSCNFWNIYASLQLCFFPFKYGSCISRNWLQKTQQKR